MGFPTAPDLWATSFTPIPAFDGVETDADLDGTVDFDALPNARGTVSLALQSGQPNSGTTSFFINLGDNSSILDDGGFVPFARIRDMATVDRIMQLQQVDLSQEVGQPGSLAFIDVPLTERDRIVVVHDVSVVEADADFSFVGPIATALQLAMRDEMAAQIAMVDEAGGSSESLSQSVADLTQPASASAAPAGNGVPEPASAALAVMGLLAASRLPGRRPRP
jgi:cyclophilin family peptidyl-prolyl cis-trans isomerase